jgi:hypothetical protein
MILGATRGDAQITTVIAPPKQSEAKQQEAARRQAAAQDSVARVTLTDMKEWVDSAAASLAIRPDTGPVPAADSTRSPAQAANPQPNVRSDSAASAERREGAPGVFRDGARAPDTATDVPTIALIGALLVLVGLALGRRRVPVRR